MEDAGERVIEKEVEREGEEREREGGRERENDRITKTHLVCDALEPHGAGRSSGDPHPDR